MKRLPSCLFILIPLSFTGCTQFLPHRDFLTEMERDDSSFYTPNNDFPVVVGDTGRTWETSKERQMRTPASESDRFEERNRLSLEEELRHLESEESQESLSFYDQNKHLLSTTSERIYFLRLSSYERRDYLRSKGWREERRPSSHKMFGLRQSSINLGMSKDDILEGWGKPLRVEIAGNPSYENERWLYNVNGATKYIYFESGRVGGWE